MKRTSILLGTVLATLSLGASLALASAGVSINTGKIVLDKAIIPGATYDLPNVEVTNIGDGVAQYEMSVEYNEVQSQAKPDATWFTFSPSSFELKPGESKIVKSTVMPGVSAKPGDYFAYVEASSVKAPNGGSVSGAAATKLYFSVASTSAMKTFFYSLVSFVHAHSPWSYIVLWALALVILSLIVKKLKHAHKIVTARSTTH